MKKLILILLPVLILGAGAALVFMGIIKIPGLNLKAKAKANQLYGEAKDPKLAAKTEPPKKDPVKADPVKKKPTPPKTETTVTEKKPEAGQKKLAKLWNEMEPDALKDVTKDWKEVELAGVLLKMDNSKVAEFLGAIEPKRASLISKELQKQASVVVPKTST